jgi:hypothetical protein
MFERAEIVGRKEFFGKIAAPTKMLLFHCACDRQNKPSSLVDLVQFAKIGDKERL